MIQIKLEQSKLDSLKVWFIKMIEENTSICFSEVDTFLQANGIATGLTFKKILVCDFDNLEKIKNELDVKKTDPKQIELKKIKGVYSKIDRIELISQLGVTVCPYCNRDYINNRGQNASAQFDHFYSKSKYPLFAVSLFNLVPVCYTCNHIKGVKPISYSPHQKNAVDDTLRFSYSIIDADYFNDSSKIKIELCDIEIDVGKDLHDNIEKLKLRQAYAIHSDLVAELIKKSVVYNDLKINEMLKSHPFLFKDRAEVVRTLYGNYIERDDFGKRPLAKLTHDILAELDIKKK